MQSRGDLEVESSDSQQFLVQQLEKLESARSASDQTNKDGKKDQTSKQSSIRGSDESRERDSGIVIEEGRVNEHIGPVQFNMGGIQVDADDMLKRLKVGSNLRMVCTIPLTEYVGP
jgi:dynein light intermediate chain 1